MNKRIICILLFWLIVAAGCTPKIVITSEPAPDFHLARYRTFAFYEVAASGTGLEENDKPKVALLQNEIARQLQARGLQQVTQNPDLLVNIGIVVEEKVQTRQTNFVTDPPTYIGQRRYTWKSKEVEVGRYKTGTVTLDLVNPDRNELVWQGTAESILQEKDKKLQEQVAKGIQELISRVPQ
ncbi:DUF4136 domain-containing protein [Pontibacter liquoris]|uniref:DUF4136 domain-containing protein n=1 Tax=Pontibacter liquoris TaxID=2905677 RepID=UPI001FA742A4|nr:DUF4136 domain-containing protein [Pontibacter liquoris]